MKKLTLLTIVIVIAMLVGYCVTSEAATVDQTATVAATATVSGSTTLSVTPTTIAYGTSSTDKYPTTPTTGKVVLTYSSNYNPWKIDIYTDNTAVPLFAQAGGKYSKGGLLSGTAPNQNLVPCKWVAKIGTNTTAPTVPTAATYNFVKDERDEDDSATSAYDESWATGFAGGYPNIAYGSSTGAGFCVDPTNSPSFQGDAVTAASGISVYIAGMFATSGVSPAVPAAGGSYATNFKFDLYHE